MEEAQTRFRLVNVTAQRKQLSHQYNLALERGDTETYPDHPLPLTTAQPSVPRFLSIPDLL